MKEITKPFLCGDIVTAPGYPHMTVCAVEPYSRTAWVMFTDGSLRATTLPLAVLHHVH